MYNKIKNKKIPLYILEAGTTKTLENWMITWLDELNEISSNGSIYFFKKGDVVYYHQSVLQIGLLELWNQLEKI